MSTEIDRKENQCYNISATRFYGQGGLSVQFTVGDGTQWMCVSLPKQDAIDFCCNIIKSMNEFK